MSWRGMSSITQTDILYKFSSSTLPRVFQVSIKKSAQPSGSVIYNSWFAESCHETRPVRSLLQQLNIIDYWTVIVKSIIELIRK